MEESIHAAVGMFSRRKCIEASERKVDRVTTMFRTFLREGRRGGWGILRIFVAKDLSKIALTHARSGAFIVVLPTMIAGCSRLAGFAVIYELFTQ